MYQEDGAAHHFRTVFVRQSFFMFVSLLCKLVNTQFLNDFIFEGKNYSDLPDPYVTAHESLGSKNFDQVFMH